MSNQEDKSTHHEPHSLVERMKEIYEHMDPQLALGMRPDEFHAITREDLVEVEKAEEEDDGTPPITNRMKEVYEKLGSKNQPEAFGMRVDEFHGISREDLLELERVREEEAEELSRDPSYKKKVDDMLDRISHKLDGFRGDEWHGIGHEDLEALEKDADETENPTDNVPSVNRPLTEPSDNLHITTKHTDTGFANEQMERVGRDIIENANASYWKGAMEGVKASESENAHKPSSFFGGSTEKGVVSNQSTLVKGERPDEKQHTDKENYANIYKPVN